MPKLLEENPNVGDFKESEKARECSDVKYLNACKRVKNENLKRITAAPAITSNASLVIPPDPTPAWPLCHASYSS